MYLYDDLYDPPVTKAPYLSKERIMLLAKSAHEVQRKIAEDCFSMLREVENVDSQK